MDESQSGASGAGRGPKTNETGRYEVYEVFVQRNELTHHAHVGSVVAPSPDIALLVARENFLRRETAVSLWVAPQRHVYASSHDDRDFFANQELDKAYRDVRGYADNAYKWKALKAQPMTIDDVVQDMKRS